MNQNYKTHEYVCSFLYNNRNPLRSYSNQQLAMWNVLSSTMKCYLLNIFLQFIQQGTDIQPSLS